MPLRALKFHCLRRRYLEKEEDKEAHKPFSPL